ncbi:hypothetical protein LK06_012315 [Streptomyces pluripotens]|nr:hypothetical protein LK06_012315 [Streptomyces pluripotens]
MSRDISLLLQRKTGKTSKENTPSWAATESGVFCTSDCTNTFLRGAAVSDWSVSGQAASVSSSVALSYLERHHARMASRTVANRPLGRRPMGGPPAG